jgi:chemotaxis signal transduction protein
MSSSASIENISGLLIFQIGELEFCTDLKLISAIMKPDEVKTNRSGNRLTHEFSERKYMTIDFAAYYSLMSDKTLDSCRILFLEVYGQKISFFVDKVLEIISLDKIFIEESVGMELLTDRDYLSYIMSIQDDKFYFPDYDRIAKEVHSINAV